MSRAEGAFTASALPLMKAVQRRTSRQSGAFFCVLLSLNLLLLFPLMLPIAPGLFRDPGGDFALLVLPADPVQGCAFHRHCGLHPGDGLHGGS